MKKLEIFKQEIERINQKTVEIESVLSQKQFELSEKQRLIHDLKVQLELEEERAQEINRQITKLTKEETALITEIQTLSDRLSAINEGKGRRLLSFRDEAKEEVDKEVEKYVQEYHAKQHDLKQIRGVIIEHLLEMRSARASARDVLNTFEQLSKQVDEKYVGVSDKNPVPLKNISALQDNANGNYYPVLSLYQELHYALDNGIAPSWFDYWKLTGEILSPAEIAAKEAKK